MWSDSDPQCGPSDSDPLWSDSDEPIASDAPCASREGRVPWSMASTCPRAGAGAARVGRQRDRPGWSDSDSDPCNSGRAGPARIARKDGAAPDDAPGRCPRSLARRGIPMTRMRAHRRWVDDAFGAPADLAGWAKEGSKESMGMSSREGSVGAIQATDLRQSKGRFPIGDHESKDRYAIRVTRDPGHERSESRAIRVTSDPSHECFSPHLPRRGALGGKGVGPEVVRSSSDSWRLLMKAA